MKLEMEFGRVCFENIKITSVKNESDDCDIVSFTADIVPEDNCPCRVLVDWSESDITSVGIVSGKIEGEYSACDIPHFTNINKYARYIEEDPCTSFILEKEMDSIEKTMTFSQDWGFDPLDEWGLVSVYKATITLSDKSYKEISDFFNEGDEVFEDDDDFEGESPVVMGDPTDVYFEESVSSSPKSKRNTRRFLRKKLDESSKNTNRLREDYGWEIKRDSEWDAFDYLAEVLGYEELAVAIAKAIGTDELGKTLAYICRNYDIEGDFLEGYEEEED